MEPTLLIKWIPSLVNHINEPRKTAYRPAEPLGQSESASNYGNRYLFTGREFLFKLNLYDYRNRFYSADLGRWLERDPLKNAELRQGPNLYEYVKNDPTNLIDPDGRVAVADDIIEAGILAGMTHEMSQRQKNLDYDAYKSRCNESPPPGMSPYDEARWKLQRNEDCALCAPHLQISIMEETLTQGTNYKWIN